MYSTYCHSHCKCTCTCHFRYVSRSWYHLIKCTADCAVTPPIGGGNSLIARLYSSKFEWNLLPRVLEQRRAVTPGGNSNPIKDNYPPFTACDALTGLPHVKCKAGKRDEAFFRKELPLSYRILRTTILIKHMYILLLMTHEAFFSSCHWLPSNWRCLSRHFHLLGSWNIIKRIQRI